MDIKELGESLANVSDPRRDYGNLRHKLTSILVIALCSEICGGEGFDDMEEFGEAREEWLRTFLELPNGIPTSDTFRRVFERVDSRELLQSLNDWLDKECIYRSLDTLRTVLAVFVDAYNKFGEAKLKYRIPVNHVSSKPGHHLHKYRDLPFSVLSFL